MKTLTRRDAARTLAATALVGIASVSAEAGTADPVFSLITKAEAVRATYQQEDGRVWCAEEAVAVCAPATVAGFLAKARFLGTIPWPDDDYLARLGEDAARLAGEVA